MKHLIRQVEERLGCKVYRNSLPRGTDLARDLQRFYPSHDLRTIFDVGANVGETALYLARHFPLATIYAFEPVSSTFEMLSDRTRKHPHIHPLHMALGDEVGMAEISLSQYSTANSLVVDHGSLSESVRCSTVDQIAKEKGLSSIDFLKIDVEGFEEKVLEGAHGLLSSSSIRFLHIEAEPFETAHHFVPLHRLNTILSRYGLRLAGLYDQQGYDDKGSVNLYFNALYALAP